MDHTTDDAYLRSIAMRYGFQYDNVDPTAPSFANFEEENEEAEYVPLRRRRNVD